MVCLLMRPPPCSLLLALKRWFNTDRILLTHPDLLAATFPPTVPYELHFRSFPDTSSATQLSVTLKMEATHTFQMSQQVPQSPPYFQHPLCKPENLHDNSCCHLSNSCYWSRQYNFRGPKYTKDHEEPAWECCMKLSSCTVKVTIDTTLCWNWIFSIAKSRSVCHAVWLTVSAVGCLEMTSVTPCLSGLFGTWHC